MPYAMFVLCKCKQNYFNTFAHGGSLLQFLKKDNCLSWAKDRFIDRSFSKPGRNSDAQLEEEKKGIKYFLNYWAENEEGLG